ncbi:hypothetical protein EJ07DRAFT_163629 [Lizonia empirigonia]|nr:hypothetical protein EJ07DRAFT_163629 [Lizonia empirigonia]
MSTSPSSSYIDYEAILAPSFSAPLFANTLLLATNNPTDTPLDLSTPLSRVLFDVQEIDTHIDTLTTASALPLLEHTRAQAGASARVLAEVEAQVAALTASYATLEREVVARYEAAEQVWRVAERLVQTVRLARAVGRCVMLGRQLEGPGRCAETLVALRQVLGATGAGEEGEGLERVEVVGVLRREVVEPRERSVVARATQVVKEFSMSSLLAASGAASFAQTEEMKNKTTTALQTLWLLSPTTPKSTPDNFVPELMLGALQDYLQTSLKSSLASLVRALTQLPLLDRTLLEISARCQNIVALQSLLESSKPPAHPLLSQTSLSTAAATTTTTTTTTTTSPPPPPPTTLLAPLLHALDTSSLPSYFWRTLASHMAPRMHELMHKGGVSARTLRSNKERVREAVRECGWEREAAVMVGSVVGGLSRGGWEEGV